MTYLYNKENPKGKLFKDDEVAESLKNGWVDNPSKIKDEVTLVAETPKKRVKNGNSKTDN